MQYLAATSKTTKSSWFISEANLSTSQRAKSMLQTTILKELKLNYCDDEWFALETNRDYSVVFDVALKYYISDSFLTVRATAFLLREFWPTLVNIMVI